MFLIIRRTTKMNHENALSIAMQQMPVPTACELMVKVLGDAQKQAYYCVSGCETLSKLENLPPGVSATIARLQDQLITHALCAFEDVLRKTCIASLFDEHRVVVHKDEARGEWFLVPPLSLLRKMIFKPSFEVQAECDQLMQTALEEAQMGCSKNDHRVYELRVCANWMAITGDGIKFV